MERQVRLGTFIVTFSLSTEGFAQTQTSTTVPAPPASKPSEPPTTDVLPSGGVTWLLIGLAVGFVAGYIVGKNSAKNVAAR
jgi:hypothetical protein